MGRWNGQMDGPLTDDCGDELEVPRITIHQGYFHGLVNTDQ